MLNHGIDQDLGSGSVERNGENCIEKQESHGVAKIDFRNAYTKLTEFRCSTYSTLVYFD